MPGLGSSATAGNGGDGSDRQGSAGQAATIVGDGADHTFEVASTDGGAMRQGGSTRIDWRAASPASPDAPGATPAGDLASTGPDGIGAGLGVGAALILVGAFLTARRRRRVMV